MRIFLLKTLVFLAAFLIFQIELILGKAILPGFGGGYLVWGISVVFYQGALFLGYLYVHLLDRHFRFSQYRMGHAGLAVLSLLLLPVDMAPLQNPAYAWPVAIEIVALLSAAIGPLFLILSSLSVYAQIHLSASALPERENPYVLYAASNMGAFAALLTYPFFTEPLFDIGTQLRQWEMAYAAVTALVCAVQWIIPPAQESARAGGKSFAPPSPARLSQWLLWSAAGSAMFLSVTNELTFNLAPVPLLWVIPLAIYLLTLVLAFKKNPFCPDWLRDRFYLFVNAGIFLFLFKLTDNSIPEYLAAFKLSAYRPVWILGLLAEPALLMAICFVFCLVCHFCLNDSKPKEPEQLTSFYLAISVGGFLGGALVNWVVPLVYNVTVESLLSYLLGSAAFAISSRAAIFEKKFAALWFAVVALVFAWPAGIYFSNSQSIKRLSVIAGVLIFVSLLRLRKNHAQIALVISGLLVAVPFVDYFKGTLVFRKRDYYGVYKVFDYGGFRYLSHGSVVHGAQFLDDARKTEPLTYYHRESPVGEFLYKNPLKFTHIALIGLGTGSLAAYAGPSNRYVYYEIDPLVGDLAKKYFAFIPNSGGEVRMVFGDARVSLRKEPPGIFDAIVVDVFNSGSIPVHLMTVETINEYRRILKPDGIVFFHVTNEYLNLVSVLVANSVKTRLFAAVKYTGFKNVPEQEGTLWVALTQDRSVCYLLQSSFGWGTPNTNSVEPWTDRYSSLLSVIKK